MTDISLLTFFKMLGAIGLTVVIFQVIAWLQSAFNKIWLNPMLFTIIMVIAILLFFDITFTDYYLATTPLHSLLEPAIVALGYPLYQHFSTIGRQWKSIVAILLLAVFLAVALSFILTFALIENDSIAVSLALKSVTTPIGIALTEQLQGNSAITAFAIILAGFFGGLLGPRWLNLINVNSSKAQGLAIGAASHALGTASVSKLSYEHAAYGSVSLIFCAIATAIMSPPLINFLRTCF